MKSATLFAAFAAFALLAAASLQAQTVTGSGDSKSGDSILTQSDVTASGATQDAPDATAPIAGSFASIVGGRLVIGGSAVVIPDGLVATGSAPPAYSVKKSTEEFKDTRALPDDFSLVLSAGPATDIAVSPGLEGGTVIATAGSSIRSVSAVVTNPLNSTHVVAVDASEIESTASFAKSSGANPIASGTTTLSGLKVDLSFLGLGVHEYSGKPKPNTLLFKSADGSVKIYLNRQITMLVDAADQPGTFVAKNITVEAIDVHLTDLRIADRTISGDIEIGTSYAQ